MKIQKNDFVELKFTGRIKDGEIFDSNIPADAKKIGLKISDKPFVICIGKEMVLSGLDKAIVDKEIGKDYTIELEPKDAFGDRKREMVKLISLNVFTQQKISPKAGMTLNLDNHLVRIASVSGGRVLVDFNNPLSGKELVYDFKIEKIVTDQKDKVDSIMEYFMKQTPKFEIKDKKAVFEPNTVIQPMLDMINEKFKDVLEVELVVKEEKKKESENTNTSDDNKVEESREVKEKSLESSDSEVNK